MQLDFDIEATDIDGLKDFVQDAIHESDFSDTIGDAVKDELHDQLDDVLDQKVVDVLRDNEYARDIMQAEAHKYVEELLKQPPTDDFEKKVRSIVKECLQEVLNNLFNVPK